MKNYIRQDEALEVLKRNSKLDSGRLYLLQSETVAKEDFFGSLEEVRYAKGMFRKHFRGILKLVEEIYTKGGYALVVKVEDEEVVKEEWRKRGKSEAVVSRIVSEVVRFALSAISKNRNRVLGRSGSVVRENFRSFVIKGEKGLNRLRKKMRKRELVLHCRKVVSEGFGYWKVTKISDHVLRKWVRDTFKHYFPNSNLQYTSIMNI